MADPREQFFADARTLLLAGERLAEEIHEFNEMSRTAMAEIESGQRAADTFARHDSAVWSRRLSARLEEFEAGRRAMRTSVAGLLLAEGRNVNDIGRVFGVSHQLASRFARAAKDGASD